MCRAAEVTVEGCEVYALVDSISLIFLGCEKRSELPESPVFETRGASAPTNNTDSEQGMNPEFGPVPAGLLVADVISLEFAVYLFADLDEDLYELTEAAVDVHAGLLNIAAIDDEDPKLPALFIRQPEISEYSPPTAESLHYSSRGLNDQERMKAPAARRVLVLQALSTAEQGAVVHKQMLRLTDQLARECDGLAWDEATRQVFSRQSWANERLIWTSGPPQLSSHVTMHAYRNGPLIRIVTLGMSKFGLPDVVVNDVPSGSTRSMGNLINLVCQTMYEHPRLAKRGFLEVSIDRVENPKARASQQTDILENAKRSVGLTLAYTVPEEGDAANRLVEIVFGNPEGVESPQVAQQQTISDLYGSRDEVSEISHGDELKTASKRARSEVLELKSSFTDGPDVNEELLVKAPFETSSGGKEWMWVEVVTWKGQEIDGILANDPFDVPDLRAGAKVKVDEEVLFDYIHRRSDGTQVGNETGKIIERQRKAES